MASHLLRPLTTRGCIAHCRGCVDMKSECICHCHNERGEWHPLKAQYATSRLYAHCRAITNPLRGLCPSANDGLELLSPSATGTSFYRLSNHPPQSLPQFQVVECMFSKCNPRLHPNTLSRLSFPIGGKFIFHPHKTSPRPSKAAWEVKSVITWMAN